LDIFHRRFLSLRDLLQKLPQQFLPHFSEYLFLYHPLSPQDSYSAIRNGQEDRCSWKKPGIERSTHRYKSSLDVSCPSGYHPIDPETEIGHRAMAGISTDKTKRKNTIEEPLIKGDP